MAQTMHVVMAVVTDDPSIIQRVMESFSNVSSGYAMEGIEVHIEVHPEDEDE